MTCRVVEINSFYFGWPVGANRPATFAISPANLESYLARTGPARIANAAESQAAVTANLAGPNSRCLDAANLVRCYRDSIGYEQFFIAEGAAVGIEARN